MNVIRGGGVQRDARGPDAAALNRGRLYAYPHAGALRGRSGRRRDGNWRVAMLDAFEDLAMHKTPRNLGRLADNAVVQSNVAQMEARLGAARAYLVEGIDRYLVGRR